MGLKSTPGYTKKKRNSQAKKRNAIVLINAEGKNKTEVNYLRGFSRNNLKIHFVTGGATDPVNMVKELIEEMRDKGFDKELGDLAYCLIDSDVSKGKNEKIKEADNLSKSNGIRVIVSSPCIENWFLCHFEFSTREYSSNEQVITALKEYLPNYAKESATIFNQLQDKTDFAITNAKKQEAHLLGIGRVKHTVDFQPSTEIYSLIEEIS